MNFETLGQPKDDPTPDVVSEESAFASDASLVSDEGGKKRVNSGLVVLVVIVLVSGGVFAAMRHLGSRGSLDLVDISIDYPIAEGVQTLTSDHDAVLSDLRASQEIVQVPPRLVQMNPFVWKSVEVDEAPVMVDPAVLEAQRREREARERERAIRRTLDALRLNSVMAGRVPLAQISGELVRVGDTVGEVFQVTSIEGRTVTLEADGQTYTLTLE